MFEAPPACPICQGRSNPIFEKHGCWINQCDICGHQFVDIAENHAHVKLIYDDAYFTEGGAGYPDYIADREILIDQGRRYANIIDKYANPGRMLDVGCAAGFISKGFEESGWITLGVEPNESMVNFGREALGLHIEKGKFENYSKASRFDLVCMIQVISHFVDVATVIEHASRLTKPGGLLLIETWDRESFFAKMLGSSWHEYNPPSVLHWFSISSLIEVISKYGFKEIALGRPRKRISLAHAISIVNYKIQDSALSSLSGVLTWLQNMDIQLPYLGDDVFWVIFRKIGSSPQIIRQG